MKTTYKNDPLYQNTKSVFTVYNNRFKHKFANDLVSKAKMLDIEDSMLNNLKSADYDGFIRVGLEYADAVIKAEEDIAHLDGLLEGDKKLDTIGKSEGFSDSYFDLYNQLVG